MRKVLNEIKEMLERELEEIAQKRELSAGSLETIHKLTDTIKNIHKIVMLEEENYSDDGYSQRRIYSRDGDGGYGRGDWRAMGSYNRGNSYHNEPYEMEDDYSGARRGRHYVRGHYSYDDGKHHMLESLEEMKGQASGKEREIIQLCMDMLNKS